MKEQKYTLLEDCYFGTLNEIITVFEKYGYQPIVVGGVAVQIHTLALVGFESAEERLRKTDDYDIVVLGVDDEKIREIIKSLNNEIFMIKDTIFSIGIKREGAKRSILNVDYLNADDKTECTKISMNVSTKLEDLDYFPPTTAGSMYEDATEIIIKNSRTMSELRAVVLLLEDLIATKLSKRRKKDIIDVDNLVNTAEGKGLPIRWDRVEGEIKSIKNPYVKDKAIKLMRALKKHCALCV